MNEEDWDGPSPFEPVEEEIKQEKSAPVGANELRIVRRIEDSIKESRGPRIHVVKSRDIHNAMNFSAKVFRVLKLHGYKVEPLTVENINDSITEEESSNVIYSIDQDTIKQVLGDKLQQIDSPVQYIFDNTKLAYLQKPVLVSTVSDEFYDRYGIKNFTDQPNVKLARKKSNPVKKNYAAGSPLAIYSFYLAAISFILSGVNVMVGSYITLSSTVSFTPVPFAILIISVAAIVLRAFSLGGEDKKSVWPATTAILLFIVLLVLGFATSFNTSVQELFVDASHVLFASNTNILMVVFSLVIIGIALSRYILFIGTAAGARSYMLSLAGVALIVAVILISNLPPIPVIGGTGIPVSVPNSPLIVPQVISLLNYVFTPEIPMFGSFSYFQAVGIPQYLLLRNYILLAANLILAVSYLLAVRARKS